MKKVILIFVLTALVASGAFAQLYFSFGGGLFFSGSFGNGIKMDSENSGENLIIESKMDNISFGGFAFMDATFIEASVSFSFGIITPHYLINNEDMTSTEGKDNGYIKMNFTQLGLSILGKFPFDLGNFSLYPMVGVEYNMVVSAFNKDGSKVIVDDGHTITENFSQFGILAGLGIDLPLASAIYLRVQALFNLRFPAESINDRIKDNEYFDKAESTVGVGPRIKVGVGFRL